MDNCHPLWCALAVFAVAQLCPLLAREQIEKDYIETTNSKFDHSNADFLRMLNVRRLLRFKTTHVQLFSRCCSARLHGASVGNIASASALIPTVRQLLCRQLQL